MLNGVLDKFKISASLYFSGITILIVGLALAENLDAFFLGNISLKRITQFVIILISFFMFFFYGVFKKINIKDFSISQNVYICYFLYVVILSVFTYDFGIYSYAYDLFYFSRVIHFLSIILLIILTIIFCQNLSEREVRSSIQLLTSIGSIISIFYLLDYYFVAYDIDLLSRNAVGTAGDSVVTRFYYYGYHRLMGGFREPSHAGGFLLILLSLSFGERRILKPVLISCALILTFSIIVYIGMLVLILYYCVFAYYKNYRRDVIRFFLAIMIGFGLASLVSFSYSDDNRGSYIGHRAQLVHNETKHCNIDLGIYEYMMCKAENIPGRGYVFSYMKNQKFELFGRGLVSPYRELKSMLKTDLYPSILSGVFASYIQSGFLGIGIISVSMLFYFLNVFRDFLAGNLSVLQCRLSGATVAIISMFVLLIEEPTFFMVVVVALAMSTNVFVTRRATTA